MDALRSLIRGVLPPAGNPIVSPRWAHSPTGNNPVQTLFPGRCLTWVDSGTSALALALMDIRLRAPEVAKPEVIIPGYCCPDLVSAALYAGVKPVLSDLAPGSCHYDRGSLGGVLSDNTLAVVAINFLGLSEPIESIRKALGSHKALIIEDNAQWFPGSPGASPSTAEYQTFSFGRGKPVNLLGGGLLVSTTAPSLELGGEKEHTLKRYLYCAKCASYNTLLHPFLYQTLARNPLLKLGGTCYHDLTAIQPLPVGRRSLLDSNIQAYWARSRLAETVYREHLAELNILAPIVKGNSERLLRFPLLVDSQERRDSLLHNLNKKGLGATKLYGKTINGVDQVPLTRILGIENTANASLFAQRFLTLPLHEGVKRDHIDQTLGIVERAYC